MDDHVRRIVSYGACAFAGIGGLIAEEAPASAPIVGHGGMLLGLAALVTAFGASLMPQINMLIQQWGLKEKLTRAQAELARLGRDLDKANEEIVRLSQLAEQIPIGRKLAESAKDAADSALRELHFLQSSGLFSADFGPKEIPPVPVRSGPATMLILGRQDEAEALAGFMTARQWNVTSASSLEDSSRKLASPYEMTILDLTAFPDGAGLKLLRLLRQRFPEANVLVVRDGMNGDDIIRLDALKPDKVVSRPIDLADMAEYATLPAADSET